jgi:hypothetical protein
MATTTNYNWSTPDDTALVKDGAAAIRTLGSSADTTVKALNPGTTAGDIDYYTAATTKARIAIGTAGQVLKVNSGGTAPEWATDATGMTNPMTTTADIIYSSSGSTPARLGIGTAGQILAVNSGRTAPEWVNAPASGGMTSIASGSLSGTSVVLSSITGSYKNLYLIITSPTVNTTNPISLRLNGNTSSNYASKYGALNSTSWVLQPDYSQLYIDGANVAIPTTANDWVYTVEINDYASAKFHDIYATLRTGGTSTDYNSFNNFRQAVAITSITIKCDNGTSSFTGGSYILYGVN